MTRPTSQPFMLMKQFLWWNKKCTQYNNNMDNYNYNYNNNMDNPKHTWCHAPWEDGRSWNFETRCLQIDYFVFWNEHVQCNSPYNTLLF